MTQASKSGRRPNLPPYLKDEIFSAIEAHRKVHGSANWNLLRARFPEVFADASGKRVLFRLIAQLDKESPEAHVARRRRDLAASSPTARATRGLPGAAVLHVDLLEQMSVVFSDIECLWQACFEREPDPAHPGRERFRIDPMTGQRVVKDSRLLDRVMAHRQKAMNQALQLHEEVLDFDHWEACYEKVIKIIEEVIAGGQPHLGKEILEQIQDLNRFRLSPLRQELRAA